MTKKVTLKDVAREAGVSVATASYVLNDAPNQTIPEDTRKRVRDAAAHLNYVRNLNARALSVGRTNVLGLLFVEDDADLIAKHISYGKFIDQLERCCARQRYRLMVARIDPREPDFDIIHERKLDGVFIVGASERSFHAVAGRFPFGSPVVLVDGMIDDPLFRSVVHDVSQLIAIANARCGKQYVLVHEHSHNRSVTEWLYRESGLTSDRICAVTRDIGAFRAFAERHRGRPMLVLNEFLALQLMNDVDSADMLVACTSGCPEFLPAAVKRILPREAKAAVASELMHGLLRAPFASERNVMVGFEQHPSDE